MINYDKLPLNEVDQVILQDSPRIVCEIKEFKKRVNNRNEQTRFWKDVLDEFEQRGILD